MVLLECLRWIPKVVLRGLLTSDDGIGLVDLPHDCLIDVISRLPALDVLRCRRVCKILRALTSSPYFIELQTERAPTIILGQCLHSVTWAYPEFNYFSLNENGVLKLQPAGMFIHTSCPDLMLSFCGLLVFRCLYMTNDFQGRVYVVFNPITHEARNVFSPSLTRFMGHMCGLFFHPLSTDDGYKLLYVSVEDSQFHSCWYHIYKSTTRTWTKINTTPLNFWPPYKFDPVFVNGCLHWIVCRKEIVTSNQNFDPCMQALMVFRTDSEEICTKPHPPIIGECGKYNHHHIMNLFEMDKCLSMCHIIEDDNIMNIWVLKDYTNWRWVWTNYIHFNKIPKVPDQDISSFSMYSSSDFGKFRTKVFQVDKDRFMINWFSSGLYLMNLNPEKFKKIREKPFPHQDKNFYFCFTYKCCLRIPNV